ncbi:MAG: YigZ family protein [Acidobacteriota bacterium]
MSCDSAYVAPRTESSAELREKGSRFLALLRPAPDEEAAQTVVRELKSRYRDATHVCWAYRVGAPALVLERCADEGEPSGTAGQPILQALRAREASDAVLAVVRWYGGTKLGKGGLVRAYGGAAREAVEVASWTERYAKVAFEVEAEWSQSGEIQRLATLPDVEQKSADWGERVRLVLEVRAGRETSLVERLQALPVRWKHLDE